MTSSKGVSLIICCYNSAKRLPQTLLHIAKQHLTDTIACELIVVDNNCNDDTVEVTNAIWKELASNIPIRIVEEKTPGLSSARHRGVEEAKYEYIIFCDDDNWLATNYLQKSYEIINNNNHIGVVGGQSIAVSEIEFPDWWDKYSFGYAVGKQGNESGYADKRMFLWGAAMITRKNLFLKAFTPKYPSLLTDRKGNELSSGGDSEYCARILLMGYRLYYSEDLVFQHFIESKRLSVEYRIKMFEGHDKSQEVLKYYRELINYEKTNYKCKARNTIYLLKNLLFNRHSYNEAKEKFSILWNTSFLLGSNHTFSRVKKFQKYLEK